MAVIAASAAEKDRSAWAETWLDDWLDYQGVGAALNAMYCQRIYGPKRARK